MPNLNLHRSRAIVGCMLLGLCAFGSPIAAQTVSKPNPDLAIVGATLVDGTGAAARPNTTILIHDGRITAVGNSDEIVVPESYQAIDATGRYVIPGLADMHVHFGLGGFVATDSVAVERALHQFLFYGVTTVLNVGATGGNLDQILRLRERQSSGKLEAPKIYATGGLITVPGSHPIATIMSVPEGVDPATYDWSTRGVWVVDSPAEIRQIVRRSADAGMDGIKIVIESGPPPFGDSHPQMPTELIDAAVDEASAYGLPVFAHASSPDELADAADNGVHAVVHIVRTDGTQFVDVAHRGVYMVPTLSLHIWANTWGDPSDALTDPFLRSGVEEHVLTSLLDSPLWSGEAPTDDEWARRSRMLAILKSAYDAGVQIVAGTDTNNPFVFPGYSIHHELALMVEAGLTPAEALRSATALAAEMIGEGDTFGTVETGKRADVLILGANPLADIRNTRSIEEVIRAGEVIDRHALFD